MKNFDPINYRNVLKKCDIALMGTPVRGSLIYLQNGFKLREKLFNIGITLLNELGFIQILLSDYIDTNSIKKMDVLSEISNNYFQIKDADFYMAAGHEVSFYSLVRELLKDHSRDYTFPMQYFHFGSVYRSPKNTRFPFNYGERKSFLECYSIHESSQAAYDAISIGVNWNKKIVKEILHLPCVEVERPKVTNKQFSQKSIHIDTITPLGETIITGMTYFHNDVFTKALNVKRRDNCKKKNCYVYSNHFGLSENVLHSYLLNCYNGNGFQFFSFLAPYQISVVDTTNGIFNDLAEYRYIFDLLDENKFEYQKKCALQKDVRKIIRRNSENGIIVTILLKNNNGSLEIKFLSCGDEFSTTCENIIENIKLYFCKNDEYIIRKFEKNEKDAIIECTTIVDIAQCVSNGKVAQFYCEKSDKKVLQIESFLKGGEVLGFQNTTIASADVLDGSITTWIAFASKRL